MIKSNKKVDLNDSEVRFAKEKTMVYILIDKIMNINNYLI